ncbi:hypothetical protein BMS3Bbin04_01852 [bacterium BMS3Bbin04]|nr:hypothetical protein BMS3Bbin04_01852 [bacterium BMS3Bbin04]
MWTIPGRLETPSLRGSQNAIKEASEPWLAIYFSKFFRGAHRAIWGYSQSRINFFHLHNVEAHPYKTAPKIFDSRLPLKPISTALNLVEACNPA